MIALDRNELMTLLRDAAKRFETLLRSLSPDDAAHPVAGLDWNVGETAAHVLNVIRRGVNDFRRSTSAADLSELNALCLEETETRDPQVIADLFAADIVTLLDVNFPRLADDRLLPFHAGTKFTIKQAIGVILGEILIHGLDIAKAVGREWVVSNREATLIWLSAAGVAYGWLKPGLQLNEIYEIHFNGQDVTAWMRFADGSLEVSTEPMPSPDYVLDVEPFDFMMAIPYGRKATNDVHIQRLASMFQPL